jgi:hypothetical protein
MWLLLALAACCDCSFPYPARCDSALDPLRTTRQLSATSPSAEGGWSLAFTAPLADSEARLSLELTNHTAESVRLQGWFDAGEPPADPQVDLALRGTVAGRAEPVSVYQIVVPLPAADSADLAFRFALDTGADTGGGADTGTAAEVVDVAVQAALDLGSCDLYTDATVSQW